MGGNHLPISGSYVSLMGYSPRDGVPDISLLSGTKLQWLVFAVSSSSLQVWVGALLPPA